MENQTEDHMMECCIKKYNKQIHMSGPCLNNKDLIVIIK